jgi:hypothetical protein
MSTTTHKHHQQPKYSHSPTQYARKIIKPFPISAENNTLNPHLYITKEQFPLYILYFHLIISITPHIPIPSTKTLTTILPIPLTINPILKTLQQTHSTTAPYNHPLILPYYPIYHLFTNNSNHNNTTTKNS